MPENESQDAGDAAQDIPEIPPDIVEGRNRFLDDLRSFRAWLIDPGNKELLKNFSENQYFDIYEKFEKEYEKLIFSEEKDENPDGFWPDDMAEAIQSADIGNWDFKKTLWPYIRRWNSEKFKQGRFGSIIASLEKEQSLESKSSRNRSRSRSRERGNKKADTSKVCLVVQHFFISYQQRLAILFYSILFYSLALAILFYSNFAYSCYFICSILFYLISFACRRFYFI